MVTDEMQQRQLKLNGPKIRIQRSSEPPKNPKKIRRVTDPPHSEQPGNRPSLAPWEWVVYSLEKLNPRVWRLQTIWRLL